MLSARGPHRSDQWRRWQCLKPRGMMFLTADKRLFFFSSLCLANQVVYLDLRNHLWKVAVVKRRPACVNKRAVFCCCVFCCLMGCKNTLVDGRASDLLRRERNWKCQTLRRFFFVFCCLSGMSLWPERKTERPRNMMFAQTHDMAVSLHLSPPAGRPNE